MGRTTARRLTRAYLLGLGLLAGLTLLGGWVVLDLLRRQSDHAALINRAGAQRMLSQRTAALLPAAVDTTDPHRDWARNEARSAVARMGGSHATLAGGVRADPSAEALQTLYFGGAAPLDAAVRRFVAAASHLLSDDMADPEGAAARAAVLRAEALSDLLPALHHAVALHEADARADVGRVQSVHLVAVALALLLMLAEGLLIFRPLASRTAILAAKLDEEARTDPLTGLMNRRAVAEALAAAFAVGPVAVVAVDLDHFRATNDAEGQEVGDAVLRAAAARLRGALRSGDSAGRVGGDAFVAILRGVTPEEAEAAARRLGANLEQPVRHAGRTIRLGATLGFAHAPHDARDPETLLRTADAALRRAKAAARGSLGRASPDDPVRLAREGAVAAALAAPGAVPGLVAHLQPLLRLSDGSLIGSEALARWHHPTLGTIPPDEAFAAAARLGRAADLSRQVRADAFRTVAALRREGHAPGRVGVNLAAAELLREDVVACLEEGLAAAGLVAADLSIEITEDALLDRVAHATLGRLAALRGLGARIALDDFGTGTSGLAQLLRIPLDSIKLDRTFVRGLGADGRAERVVEGTIRLAHSLGLTVVAEGVEEAAQAAALRDMGCDYAQGWLYARAMPAADFRAWLDARRPAVSPHRLRVVAAAG